MRKNLDNAEGGCKLQAANCKLLVNALTFSRLPLIFAWLGFAMAAEYGCGLWATLSAMAALALSGLTDFFDGSLARRWNVVTPLGKMADPLMDKVFYVVAFPTLTWLVQRPGESDVHALVMLVFTILCILRDLWVTFMRAVGSMYGADGAAMWLGKVRTALLFPFAGLIYFYTFLHRLLPAAGQTACLWGCFAAEAAMIVLNLYSSVAYTRVYLPYLKKALERK